MTEDQLEQETLSWLQDVGYVVRRGPDIAHDGAQPERANYREVLLLRDVHELTAPEVAAQLGLTLEAVKSRLHRARAQVREHLVSSGYWLKDGAPEPLKTVTE